LDENNPREAQAIEVIDVWASRGYSLRYLLVEAFLAIAEDKAQKDEVSSSLEEIIKMLQDLQVGSDHPRDEQGQDKRLSDEFLKAVAKTSRPGLRNE
jgi:hypothetical protein